jgi:hypothetical protein
MYPALDSGQSLKEADSKEELLAAMQMNFILQGIITITVRWFLPALPILMGGQLRETTRNMELSKVRV